MKKIAVFPGSFSPFTIGHQSLVEKALHIFDEIIIGIGTNESKKKLFSVNQRINWIKSVYNKRNNIKIMQYNGLTVDFCNENNASFIIRGLRNIKDFNFERKVSKINKKLNKNIETIFFLSENNTQHISSSMVIKTLKNGGDISDFVPKEINITL